MENPSCNNKMGFGPLHPLYVRNVCVLHAHVFSVLFLVILNTCARTVMKPPSPALHQQLIDIRATCHEERKNVHVIHTHGSGLTFCHYVVVTCWLQLCKQT
jgi:hypothetical protein